MLEKSGNAEMRICMENISKKIWDVFETVVRAVFELLFKVIGKKLDEDTWTSLLQFIKFALVGVWNTLFSFAINFLCLKIFKASGILSQILFGTPIRVYTANVIAWLISVFVSFLLNNRFVFQMEEGKKRSFWRALLKSYVSYGFTGLILNNILAMLWVGVLGIPEEIAPLISLVIAIPINFLMNKLWAFKTED